MPDFSATVYAISSFQHEQKNQHKSASKKVANKIMLKLTLAMHQSNPNNQFENCWLILIRSITSYSFIAILKTSPANAFG